MGKRLLPHKNKEIIKKLRKNGFSLKSGKSSKHFVYWKKDLDGKDWAALVSKNPSKIPSKRTLENIIRTSGKPKEEFCKK